MENKKRTSVIKTDTDCILTGFTPMDCAWKSFPIRYTGQPGKFGIALDGNIGADSTYCVTRVYGLDRDKQPLTDVMPEYTGMTLQNAAAVAMCLDYQAERKEYAEWERQLNAKINCILKRASVAK